MVSLERIHRTTAATMHGTLIGEYRCDFKVTFQDGHTEYHVPKGYKKGAAYDLFRWKKKHVEAEHGIKIVEL